MCGKVYGIYDKRTNACIYVGITKYSIYWRWGLHISSTFAKKPAQPKLNGYLLDQGYHGIVEHFEPRHLEPDMRYATRQDLRVGEQRQIDLLKPKYNAKRAVAKPLHTYRECEYCSKRVRVGSRMEHDHTCRKYPCRLYEAWLKHKAWVKTQDPKDGPFPFKY